MFDELKNMGGLEGMMAKAREMQDKVRSAQEELARKTITADAGGGMVQATVNGALELVKIRIDKSKIDLSDIEMVEDLVIAAVHGAQERAKQMVQRDMQKIASDMGIPPSMLGNM